MKKTGNRGIIISVIVAVLVVIAGGFFYFNQTSNGSKNSENVIKAGVTGTSYPNTYKANGKLTGFDVDVLNDAAKRAGYKVKWVTGEFDGLLGQVDNGQLDTVANDIAVTPERAKKYKFTDVYNKEETAVAVDKKSSLNNIDQLSGKTVSGASASNNSQNLKNYNNKIKFKMFDARDLTYEALLAGHVDGVVNTRNNLSAIIKQKHYSWKILKGSAATVNVALPFAKNNTGKIAKLNKAIAEMKKDGTLTKLAEKYFGYNAVQGIK